MEQPKVRCWIVSTQWSDGLGGLSVVYAPTEPGAVGIAVVQTMRAAPSPQGELTGVWAHEVTAPMLRQMLAVLENGQPSATVLSLVPAEPPVTSAGQNQWAQQAPQQALPQQAPSQQSPFDQALRPWMPPEPEPPPGSDAA